MADHHTTATTLPKQETSSTTPLSTSLVPTTPSATTTATALEPSRVSLRVVTQDGREVQFKIRRTSTLKKLMETFCEKMGMQMSEVRFWFNGTRVQAENTPEEMEMEDDDKIEVYLHQIGGQGC